MTGCQVAILMEDGTYWKMLRTFADVAEANRIVSRLKHLKIKAMVTCVCGDFPFRSGIPYAFGECERHDRPIDTSTPVGVEAGNS